MPANVLAKPVRVKVTVSLEIEVDPHWIDFCCSNDADVFRQSYTGYWARGMENDPTLGWLVFEEGDEVLAPKNTPPEVKRLWRNGWELPKRWHRFDLEMAKKAWAAGYQKGGVDWYESGDGPTYEGWGP